MAGISVLNEWKWPDIKGLKDFKSPLLHNANWDDNFDPAVWSALLPRGVLADIAMRARL
jgi:hypothetical protein